MWRNCQVGQQQFSRQVFLKLLLQNFERVDEDTQTALVAFCKSHNSSLLIENLFNTARRTSSANRVGRINATVLWYATSLGTRTHSDFGRPLAPITGAARAASWASCRARSSRASVSTTAPWIRRSWTG
jgi:hypothetical protein